MNAAAGIRRTLDVLAAPGERLMPGVTELKDAAGKAKDDLEKLTATAKSAIDQAKGLAAELNPQGNEEEKVLAVLDPAEREQFNGILRRMLGAIDRPGLLNMPPKSAKSGDGVARRRSRFTTDVVQE